MPILMVPVEEIPFLNFKQHTVYQLTPRAYGCDVTTFALMKD